ncbi:hypothetical protein [Methylacidiphilum kamchatkense]|nr:hypothetical protein [Methylacidiphilum kamchatkense]
MKKDPLPSRIHLPAAGWQSTTKASRKAQATVTAMEGVSRETLPIGSSLAVRDSLTYGLA